MQNVSNKDMFKAFDVIKAPLSDESSEAFDLRQVLFRLCNGISDYLTLGLGSACTFTRTNLRIPLLQQRPPVQTYA